MSNNRAIPVSISLPKKMAHLARLEAAKLDITRSKWIQHLITEALENKPTPADNGGKEAT